MPFLLPFLPLSIPGVPSRHGPLPSPCLHVFLFFCRRPPKSPSKSNQLNSTLLSFPSRVPKNQDKPGNLIKSAWITTTCGFLRSASLMTMRLFPFPKENPPSYLHDKPPTYPPPHSTKPRISRSPLQSSSPASHPPPTKSTRSDQTRRLPRMVMSGGTRSSRLVRRVGRDGVGIRQSRRPRAGPSRRRIRCKCPQERKDKILSA